MPPPGFRLGSETRWSCRSGCQQSRNSPSRGGCWAAQCSPMTRRAYRLIAVTVGTGLGVGGPGVCIGRGPTGPSPRHHPEESPPPAAAAGDGRYRTRWAHRRSPQRWPVFKWPHSRVRHGSVPFRSKCPASRSPATRKRSWTCSPGGSSRRRPDCGSACGEECDSPRRYR